MRRPIMAANWKMHMNLAEARAFIEEFKQQDIPKKVDVVICPPATLLYSLAEMLKDTPFILGAQNMHWEESGAFTGEISPVMLKDLGVKYVILGHSERRNIFKESDKVIGLKVATAFKHGLLPILCLGETIEEREKGLTKEVIRRQLETGIKEVSMGQAGNLVIAYEPVWAIGSGKAATGEDALEVATFIRELYEETFGKDNAARIRIQYGGSVKGENIGDFTRYTDIDGALVGGASLKALSWAQVIQKGEFA